MRFSTISFSALVLAVSVYSHLAIDKLSIHSPRMLDAQTNAKRFAVGLPPLPPGSRHRNRAPNGGSGVDTARRTVVSPSPPINVKCNVLLITNITGQPAGYLSPIWSSFGSYSRLQVSQIDALEISFWYRTDDPSSLSQLDIAVTNSPSSIYPFFGATLINPDSNDLSPNTNYATIGGTVQTSKGSPAVATGSSVSTSRGTESAIWRYNPNTREITAQWVNTDGSLPITSFVYIPTESLVITANATNELRPIRGSAVVNLRCVTPISSLPA